MFKKRSISTATEHTHQTTSPAVPTSCISVSSPDSASLKPVEGTVMACPLAQQISSSHPHGPDAVGKRLCAFLSRRVGDGVTLKELSRFLGYSEKYASDVFLRYMGRRFSEHLRQLRLDRATSMLLEDRYTISKIAECVGFSDAFAFSHFFKRAVGCSPTEYRRQQLRQADMA